MKDPECSINDIQTENRHRPLDSVAVSSTVNRQYGPINKTAWRCQVGLFVSIDIEVLVFVKTKIRFDMSIRMIRSRK